MIAPRGSAVSAMLKPERRKNKILKRSNGYTHQARGSLQAARTTASTTRRCAVRTNKHIDTDTFHARNNLSKDLQFPKNSPSIATFFHVSPVSAASLLATACEYASESERACVGSMRGFFATTPTEPLALAAPSDDVLSRLTALAATEAAGVLPESKQILLTSRDESIRARGSLHHEKQIRFTITCIRKKLLCREHNRPIFSHCVQFQ